MPEKTSLPPKTASNHCIWLFLSLAVVGLALVLDSHGPRQVVMPVVNIPLPEVCSARRMFNRDCPGCGLTRCFINMAHGVAGGVGAGAEGIRGRDQSARDLFTQSGRQFARAWRFNPVGTLLFVVVAAQIPYRGWQLYRLKRGRPEVPIPRRISYWWLVAFAIALFLQWSVKMIHQVLG